MARKISITLLVVATMLIAMLILVQSRNRATVVFPPPPSPNGYDDFVKAAGLVTANTSDVAVMEAGALRELIASNSVALNLIRTGLSHSCRAPTEAMVDPAATNVLERLAGFKRLAQLLNAEGCLAVMEGRTNEALIASLDGLRFGEESSRGGFVIDRLVGVACQAIAASSLGKLMPALSCEHSRPAIERLMDLDSNAVSWSEVMFCEKEYIRRQPQGLNPIRRAMDWWSTRSSLKRAKFKHDFMSAHIRLMAVELAVRCYSSENGKPPAQLFDLVPKYIPRVPLDPFTEKDFIYRPQGMNWLVYSVGEDGRDDGGLPTSRKQGSKGDILCNSP